MKKIISVVGARPNFMKIAPVQRAFTAYTSGFEHKICHTGQHFDDKMSKVFLDELGLPTPDFYLGIGGGSHAVQTAKIMVEFEKICVDEKPDLVVVVGDVNSTIGCGITAVKLGIPLAHIEAGLRSFDRRMPEEINRLLTDSISEMLFVTEQSGITNLAREGADPGKVFLTGNVMIDTVVHLMPQIDNSTIMQRLNLNEQYVLATFHRPSNVDEKDSLAGLIGFLNSVAEQKRVVFPIHPRTMKNLDAFGLKETLSPKITLTDPLGYIDFIHLMKHSFFVATDSGGIQEESTFLGVQCLTLRENTERPVTVLMGTNQLVGTDFANITVAARNLLNGQKKQGSIPPLWDGKAAERIVEIITNRLS